MTDVYCTHQAIKNKFVDKYDSMNLHQIPDESKESSVSCLNKENEAHIQIAQHKENRSPSKLGRP
jgi:hypothetical protein